MARPASGNEPECRPASGVRGRLPWKGDAPGGPFRPRRARATLQGLKQDVSDEGRTRGLVQPLEHGVDPMNTQTISTHGRQMRRGARGWTSSGRLLVVRALLHCAPPRAVVQHQRGRRRRLSRGQSNEAPRSSSTTPAQVNSKRGPQGGDRTGHTGLSKTPSRPTGGRTFRYLAPMSTWGAWSHGAADQGTSGRAVRRPSSVR